MTDRERIDTQGAQQIVSPCVGICDLDPHTGYCRGCLRTLEEVAGWLTYSNAEREQIISGLKDRQWNAGPAPRDAWRR